MLLGLVFATRGEIEVLGRPVPKRVKEVLAVGRRDGRGAGGVPAPVRADQPGACWTRPGRAAPAATGAGRIDDALDRVGLAGVDKRPVRAYSLGMRQRLGLAAALLRKPRLLILDEPTNGLDPRGIREIRDLLTELNEAGTTVFLSSHLLAEIEALCTRVGVMDRGRLVLQERLATLRAPTGRVRACSTAGRRTGGRAAGRPGGGAATAQSLTVRHPDPADLNAELLAAGHPGHRDRRRAALPGTGRRSRPPRTSSDRVDGRVIRRRAGEAVPAAADVRDHRAAVRAAVHGGGLPGHHPDPAAARAGRRVPVRGAEQRRALPGRRDGAGLPVFLPVSVAVLAGDAVAGEAAAGTLRYLLIRPVGRTRLLVAKLVSLVVFVLFAIAAVLVTSLITGLTLFGGEPSAGVALPADVTSLSGVTITPAGLVLRLLATVALHRGVDAGRGRDRAVPVHRHRLGAGRGDGRARRAGHQPGAGHAGRGRRRSSRTCRPATGWPGSTSSATRSCGATSSAASASRLVFLVVLLGAAWANFMTRDITN